MKDWNQIRARYLQDEFPVQLGGLAANLTRIKSFLQYESSRSAVESLIQESKRFIEWSAIEADIETAAELVALQVQLAVWQRKLPRMWLDPEKRAGIAKEAGLWSKRVLEMSGLLEGR